MSENDTKAEGEATPEEEKTTSEPAEKSEAANAVDTDETTGEDEFEFVEEPVFTVEAKGDCAYEVSMTIPVSNEEKLAGEMFDELKHEAELPGFRKGRAPRKLIERKFSKAVRGDVEMKLINTAFTKVLTKEKLRPIGPPDIEGLENDKDRKADEPLKVTFKFEVGPKVELGKYRGIEVERPVFKIDDKDVDEAIDNIRNRFAVYQTLDDGTAADGDQVVISFKGTIDGEEFPGGTAENYPYILGTKRFFPEFEEVLVGSATGAELTCKVSFADDYSVERLRGKTADFTITVNEIKRRNIPDLTDEFAQQLGHENAKDVREKVVAQMRESTESRTNQIAGGRALNTIIEDSTFEIPKSLIERMAEGYYEDNMDRLRKSHVPGSQIQAQEEQLRAQAREEAIREIKEWAVLSEIAETEGIEVTEEDFEKEASLLSAHTGASVEDVTQFLGQEEQRNRYEMRILNTKTLAHIMSLATVVHKEVDPEDLDAAENLANEKGEA